MFAKMQNSSRITRAKPIKPVIHCDVIIIRTVCTWFTFQSTLSNNYILTADKQAISQTAAHQCFCINHIYKEKWMVVILVICFDSAINVFTLLWVSVRKLFNLLMSAIYIYIYIFLASCIAWLKISLLISLFISKNPPSRHISDHLRQGSNVFVSRRAGQCSRLDRWNACGAHARQELGMHVHSLRNGLLNSSSPSKN